MSDMRRYFGNLQFGFLRKIMIQYYKNLFELVTYYRARAKVNTENEDYKAETGKPKGRKAQ